MEGVGERDVFLVGEGHFKIVDEKILEKWLVNNDASLWKKSMGNMDALITKRIILDKNKLYCLLMADIQSIPGQTFVLEPLRYFKWVR